MTIPLIIEATEPTGLISSDSIITLESILSASSFRFHHEDGAQYGRRNSQGPVVKPTRKQSSNDLLALFNEEDVSIGTFNLHNAVFAEDGDDARTELNKVSNP